MEPHIDNTLRRSRLRHSFTSPDGVQTTGTTISDSNVNSRDDSMTRSGDSYGSLPNKGRNPFRSGFSSLRKSAKKFFTNKSKSQSFEHEPRRASETLRVSAAEVAARFEREFAGSTGATSFEPPQVDLVDKSSVAASSSPGHTSPTVGHTPIDLNDPLPQTELIHEIPSLIVFTPSATPHVPPRPPSPPPTPPPKTEHTPFDLEAALKDIASQAVTLPPFANRSPYFNGAVVYFKCIVFALASVGICVAALPWACLELIGFPRDARSAPQGDESGDQNSMGPTDTPEVQDTHVGQSEPEGSNR